jgi:glycosyltransferase involved in cell wall biosynthesis
VPIVCSEGDPFADVVAARDLGDVVARGDGPALAEALARTAKNGRAAYAEALAAVAEERRWSRVAEPLAQRIADAPLGTRRVGAVALALAARHRTASAVARRLDRG